MTRLSMSSLRVAALCAVVLPALAGVAHAASIPASITLHYGTGANVVNDFDFGPFSFTLGIQNLTKATDITVSQTTVLSHTLPAGFVCIPIDGGSDCIQFHISENPTLNLPPNGDFTSYNVLIQWQFDTDPQYPNAPGNRVRILHFLENGGLHDTTIGGTYFAPGVTPPSCGHDSILHQVLTEQQYHQICGDDDEHESTTGGNHEHNGDDPGVMGTDDVFSDFIVAEAPAVPEPGTLLLIAGGLAVAAFGRRRR